MSQRGAQGAQGAQGPQGIQGPKGDTGEDGRSVDIRNNNGALQWRYTTGSDTDWKTLLQVSSLQGSDGRSVEFGVVGGSISWRYKGDSDASWHSIVSIASLKGADGPTGIPGEQGPTGAPGEPGKAVKIARNGDLIQWQYEGDTEWRGTIATITELTGANGKDVEITNDGTNIKWRYTSGDNTDWNNICAVADLMAPAIELTKETDAIYWHYTSGADTSNHKLVDLTDITGELAADIDMQLVKNVAVVDANGDPVMDTNGNPTYEDQIQWKPKGAADTEWQRLCAAPDLNISVNTKVANTLSKDQTMTLESGKKYQVTITVAGTNNTTASLVASASFAGKTVGGTWMAGTLDDPTDPNSNVTGFVASYCASFLVDGDGQTYTATVTDGYTTIVTVVEV